MAWGDCTQWSTLVAELGPVGCWYRLSQSSRSRSHGKSCDDESLFGHHHGELAYRKTDVSTSRNKSAVLRR